MKTFAEQFDDASDGKEFGKALTSLFNWLEKAREEEDESA